MIALYIHHHHRHHNHLSFIQLFAQLFHGLSTTELVKNDYKVDRYIPSADEITSSTDEQSVRSWDEHGTNRLAKVKRKSASDVIKEEKGKKRQRKSAAEQKKGYEHITKFVPKEQRLSEKDLLALGNDTTLTAKQRWVQAPYAWNFKGVLLEPYYHLTLKEHDEGFV